MYRSRGFKQHMESMYHDFKEIRIPMALAASGATLDRYTTWLLMGSGEGFETNVLMKNVMENIGAVEVMAVTGAGYLAGLYFLGRKIKNKKRPLNSMENIKNLLYGFGGVECFIAVQNYFKDLNYQYTGRLYELGYNFGSGLGIDTDVSSFIAIALPLLGAMYIPFLASWLRNRINRKAVFNSTRKVKRKMGFYGGMNNEKNMKNLMADEMREFKEMHPHLHETD